MKLTVNRDQIIDGIQKAASIIPLKAPSVSLRSIWLKAENDQLSIMATDADLEFTGIYPAKVEEGGLVGVPGKAFADLVAKWPSGEIHLTLDEKSSTLHLEQRRRSYKLPISTAEWFQPFGAWPEGEGVLWNGETLTGILDRVAFCIDDDDARDAMACLYLKPVGEGKIDACGLNGCQFAMISFINDDLAALFGQDGLMIQKKYLNDLKKWLVPSEIDLNLTEKRLFLKQLDGAETLSVPRYSRNPYPDYNVFLAKLEGEGEGQLSAPRKASLDAMSRIMVFMSEGNRCVFMDLAPEELHLTAQGMDNGSGSETLEANFTGSLKHIAFPNKDMMEIFGHFDSEIINLKFTGAEGPCGITGDEDPNYKIVIMPMRVSDLTYYDEPND